MTDKETFKEFLQSKPVAFYPDFSEIGGSTNAGVLLSQLFYWKDKESDEDGWIYKTQKEWKNEIKLTRTEQETARKKLRDSGILREKLKGNPSKLYYKIDFDAMIAALSKIYEKRRQVAGSLHAETPHAMDAENPQASLQGSNILSLTEITTKNTAESSSPISLLPKPFEKANVKNGSKKDKKTLDLSSIEQVLVILKTEDKNAEKGISLNLKRMIEIAIETHGAQYICDAVKGRMKQAADRARKTGEEKRLMLKTFFDPDNVDWFAECAKIGEAMRDATEGQRIASASKSQAVVTTEDVDNIYRLMSAQ